MTADPTEHHSTSAQRVQAALQAVQHTFGTCSAQAVQCMAEYCN
jgi:hypothetical protein